MLVVLDVIRFQVGPDIGGRPRRPAQFRDLACTTQRALREWRGAAFSGRWHTALQESEPSLSPGVGNNLACMFREHCIAFGVRWSRVDIDQSTLDTWASGGRAA
jgi:hypothetical protein